MASGRNEEEHRSGAAIDVYVLPVQPSCAGAQYTHCLASDRHVDA